MGDFAYFGKHECPGWEEGGGEHLHGDLEDLHGQRERPAAAKCEPGGKRPCGEPHCEIGKKT